MNAKKKTNIIANILAFIIATLVMIAIADVEKYDTIYDVDQYTDFSKIEHLEDGTVRYYMQLDNEKEYAMSLAIRTSFQTLHVYAGDDLLYALEVPANQAFLDMPACQWNIIQIPSRYQNSILVLEYYSSYDAYSDYSPTVYLGNASDLLSNLIAKTFGDNVLSWLTIIFAVATFIVCYIVNKASFKYMKYLSLFLLMFGMWTWGEGQSYFFNYAPLNIQTTITFYMVMLMPIPIMLYLKNNPKAFYVNKNASNALIRIYLIACILEMILGTYLYVFDILDLMEYLTVPIIFLSLGALLLVFFEIKSSIRNFYQKELFNPAPIIIFAFSCILEVFAFIRGDFFCIGVYSKIGVLIFVSNIYFEELFERNQERKNLEALEASLLQANIHIMTTKMKPHFIHNTLLAIQELCYSDPMQAYNAIGLFSKYLRSNIEGVDQKELVSFETELEYINIYIEIQKMCYEDAISFETDIAFSDFKIPPFTIQPLVENAITHGILKSRNKGHVILRTSLRDNLVFIEVSDNGAGFDYSQVNTGKFNSGDAVMFRIKHLLHGDVAIESKINVGTSILVTIPQKL